VRILLVLILYTTSQVRKAIILVSWRLTNERLGLETGKFGTETRSVSNYSTHC